MERVTTTLLDVLGLLLVAAGAYFFAEPYMGYSALMVAGAVVLGGSAWASRDPSPNPLHKRAAAWARKQAPRAVEWARARRRSTA